MLCDRHRQERETGCPWDSSLPARFRGMSIRDADIVHCVDCLAEERYIDEYLATNQAPPIAHAQGLPQTSSTAPIMSTNDATRPNPDIITHNRKERKFTDLKSPNAIAKGFSRLSLRDTIEKSMEMGRTKQKPRQKMNGEADLSTDSVQSNDTAATTSLIINKQPSDDVGDAMQNESTDTTSRSITDKDSEKDDDSDYIDVEATHNSEATISEFELLQPDPQSTAPKPKKKRKNKKKKAKKDDDKATSNAEVPEQDSKAAPAKTGPSRGDIISCKCNRNVNDGRPMVCCDHCRKWQHQGCMQLFGVANVDGEHLCHTCEFKVVSMCHLKQLVPEVYELNDSPYKAYVDFWIAKGRVNAFG